MRRRLLPLLIAVLAVAVAVWQRSRRRAAALLPAAKPADRTTDGASALTLATPRLLEAGSPPPGADDAAIDDTTGDLTIEPNRQVEGETSSESSSYGARFVSIAWEPIPDPPPGDAGDLTIRFSLPEPHAELDRIDVRETGSHVFVTVIARVEPPPDDDATEPPAGGRPAPAREHEATVALREPLGERTLVHAPTDHLPGRAA